MEATPPDEPIQKKPSAPPPAKTRKRKPVEAAPVEPVQEPVPTVEFETEQEATRVLGALALGVMALLLFCVIALLIAYRNVPEGL